MKKLIFILGCGSLLTLFSGSFFTAMAQSTPDREAFQNGAFTGAKADQANYNRHLSK